MTSGTTGSPPLITGKATILYPLIDYYFPEREFRIILSLFKITDDCLALIGSSWLQESLHHRPTLLLWPVHGCF